MKKLILSILVASIVLINYLSVYAGSFTLSYLFAGTSVTYTNYVSVTKGMLNTICTDYFEINTDGSLKVQKIDKAFIDNMHKANIYVAPYLSNNWDKELGLLALNNSDEFTSQLAKAIYDNNLDGVDVDIQNVSHLYRDSYTNFVRMLREKMPDKQISVAVAANPNSWTTGWHGSYDYKALAQYCDYLMIMAYDESYYGSPAGPVASSSFVENSIIYALKHTSPDKLVLGIPFYGRYWKTGTSKGGNGIISKDIENLIVNYDSSVHYDDEKQSVRVVVTIRDSDIKPRLWGGNVLSAGEYVIWYDNIQSLKHKLDLAEKYELLGTGSWALGQENVSIWDEYSLRKNKASDVDNLDNDIPINNDGGNQPEPPTPLLDISGHWAYDNIVAVYNKDWMTGASYSKFAPDRNLTRAEAATLLMRAADLPDILDVDLDISDDMLIFEDVTSEESEDNWDKILSMYDFGDTKDHWARKYIAKAHFYNILSGRGNNLFYPNDFITREEMSLVIDKVFNLAESVDFNNNPFYDIDKIKNEWSYNSIIKLSENNVVTGYSDKSFRPKNKITRAETAAILNRLFGYGINSFIENNNLEEYEPNDEDEEVVPEIPSLGEFKEIQLPR